MKIVDFAPVDTGDMAQIPPDAPAGKWTASVDVKKSKTAKDSYPMLILEWRLKESHDGGDNENAVGAKVTDFLTFFPAGHKATRMSLQKLRSLCDAFSITPPSVRRLESWDDIGDFVTALEGAEGVIYTTVAPRKDNGELSVSVHYAPPPGTHYKTEFKPHVSPVVSEKKKRKVA